jgi:hypothetical protein
MHGPAAKITIEVTGHDALVVGNSITGIGDFTQNLSQLRIARI